MKRVYRYILTSILRYLLPKKYFEKKTNIDLSYIAKYYYSVFMRIYIKLKDNGIDLINKDIVEIGPGYSLGFGFCALLLGAKSYTAFDIVPLVNIENEYIIFNKIRDFFNCKASIPNENEFSGIYPKLDKYDFPFNYIECDLLNKNLNKFSDSYINKIVAQLNVQDSLLIKYVAPYRLSDIGSGIADILISHAVLEYFSNLNEIFTAMKNMLKNNGIMVHEIDLRSHSTSEKWNGQYTYSEFIWRLMRGNRKAFINREPYSTYKKEIEKTNMEILYKEVRIKESDTQRYQLKGRYKNLTDDDLQTWSLFFIAKNS